MKILKRPAVRLIVRPTFDWSKFNGFLEEFYGIKDGPELEHESKMHAYGHPGEAATMMAGKSCYKSWTVGKKNIKEYLEHILQSGHGSVLEHISYGFMVLTTRAITHEIVRHRAGWAYSQESQRFCDEKNNSFIMPLSIQGVSEAEKIWVDDMEKAMANYVALTDSLFAKYSADPTYADLSKTDLRKKVREASRGVLPNDTATLIHMTGNVRSLRHFIEMRGSRHAEAGIRMIANDMLDILIQECPILFGDYVKTQLPDGTYEITTNMAKV